MGSIASKPHKLYQCAFIWFDPHVNSEENKSWHLSLQECSLYELFLIEKWEKVLELIEDAQTTQNFVLISSGRNYLQIRKAVEESSRVKIIMIYCRDVYKYEEFPKENIKVWLITDNFSAILNSVRERSINEQHNRLEEFFNKQTFYTEENSKELIERQEQLGSPNIFYPQGYDILSPERMSRLEEKLRVLRRNLVPMICKRDKIRGREMKDRIRILLKNKLTKEDILSSYLEGIYTTLNNYLKGADLETIRAFGEYELYLRACMSFFGSVVKVKAVFYKGLYIPMHLASYWVHNIGKVGKGLLLSSFMSSTSSLEEATKYIHEDKTGMRKVILEITLIEDKEMFEKQLRKFLHEKSGNKGSFYPVNITKYGEMEECMEGEELVFPPLYPLILQRIRLDRDILTVRSIAPVSLSYGLNPIEFT